jgi:hypothetical protein
MATLELPDALEPSADAAGPVSAAAPSAGGVDDLLAQMAGEEIDRLLAEADAAREEAAAGAGATPPLERAAEKPSAAASDPPPAPAARETAAASVASEVISGTGGVELELATSSEERSALELAATSQEPAPIQIDASIFEDPAEESAPAAQTVTDDESATGDSLPIYLKPLEWINAPLVALPDRVRELLGKVALLTFFNALAVLLYVMIFRKHH